MHRIEGETIFKLTHGTAEACRLEHRFDLGSISARMVWPRFSKRMSAFIHKSSPGFETLQTVGAGSSRIPACLGSQLTSSLASPRPETRHGTM
ncbi:hypothetical protein ZHAS_00005622 [Anopheles sinensis]|uniref:Uncharacterized protein n=1 Tax=Anopheles sinensis TaxID=74873 RepID=A0A084VJZ3_ANOSI|nr:hypothetical protein ZHAS_00005622 [Anopheles sinensis]